MWKDTPYAHVMVPTGLARIFHQPFCCERRGRAISGRARLSLLDVLSSTPPSVEAPLDPI